MPVAATMLLLGASGQFHGGSRRRIPNLYHAHDHRLPASRDARIRSSSSRD